MAQWTPGTLPDPRIHSSLTHAHRTLINTPAPTLPDTLTLTLSPTIYRKLRRALEGRNTKTGKGNRGWNQSGGPTPEPNPDPDE